MKYYYLYIKAGLEIDLETRFFKVGIGASKRDQKIRAWLEAFAIEHGHFFCIWSEHAAQFFLKCRNQIGEGAAPLIWVDAAQLRRDLNTGCEDPVIWQAIQHRHKLLMQIDSKYYFHYQISKR